MSARLDAAAASVPGFDPALVDWSAALCRGDTEQMFQRVQDVQWVMQRCSVCPIRDECLIDAVASERMDQTSVYGIRSATTASERIRWIQHSNVGVVV